MMERAAIVSPYGMKFLEFALVTAVFVSSWKWSWEYEKKIATISLRCREYSARRVVIVIAYEMGSPGGRNKNQKSRKIERTENLC
jgi:hypothetical protein